MNDFDSMFSSAMNNKSSERSNTWRVPSTPETTGVEVTRNDIFNDEDRYDTAPVSKRANKNRSGKRNKAAWNAQRWVSKVGGYNDAVQAIYAPADKEMCVVVRSDRGYNPDGTPFRF